MQEKTRRAAGALGKAVLYGGAAALGLAILTFLFAFLTGGFDARLGLDWARRVLYVIGGVCVVVSGAGLFFAGAPRVTSALASRRTRPSLPLSARRESAGPGRC